MKTFAYKPVIKEGKTFHILTAEQYPWSHLQVVTFPSEEYDESMEKLKKVYGTNIGQHPDRKDFAIIQAGGSSRVVTITQENATQVAKDIRQCLDDAVVWWMENAPEL